jgi:hypothetical protein
MSQFNLMVRASAASALAAVLLLGAAASADAKLHAQKIAKPWIVGTWVLAAADKITPDGARSADYGPSPHGLVIFTAEGYYSLQIYRADRPKFASGDKFDGTPEEYKEISLGMSTSFGRYEVDDAKHIIIFHRDRSSVPNGDDKTGVDPYELKGDELTWKVAARKDGTIPITVLRRVK